MGMKHFHIYAHINRKIVLLISRYLLKKCQHHKQWIKYKKAQKWEQKQISQIMSSRKITPDKSGFQFLERWTKELY